MNENSTVRRQDADRTDAETETPPTSVKNTAEISRTPSDYRPADHYVIRARRGYGPVSETRTNPPITADVTRTCISQGEIREAREGCTKFIAEVAGFTWHLVTDGDRVVTAYVPGRHGGHDVPRGEGQ